MPIGDAPTKILAAVGMGIAEPLSGDLGSQIGRVSADDLRPKSGPPRIPLGRDVKLPEVESRLGLGGRRGRGLLAAG